MNRVVLVVYWRSEINKCGGSLFGYLRGGLEGVRLDVNERSITG